MQKKIFRNENQYMEIIFHGKLAGVPNLMSGDVKINLKLIRRGEKSQYTS